MASRFEVTQRMFKLWLRITAIVIKINHAQQIILIHFRFNFTLSDNSSNVYKQCASPVSYKNKSIMKHNDDPILRSYHIILTSCSNLYELFPNKIF